MKFLDWLESETAALDRLDAMERGDLPIGPITFTKRDGSTFEEFIEFVKRDGGQEQHLICNAGGLSLMESESADLDGATVAAELAGLDRTADNVLAKVADLQKRVDAIAERQADTVEVTPEQLAALFTEAITEAGDTDE